MYTATHNEHLKKFKDFHKNQSAILFATGSREELRPKNEIAVLMPYQNIDDRPAIFTRINAIAARITAETIE